MKQWKSRTMKASQETSATANERGTCIAISIIELVPINSLSKGVRAG